MEDFSHMLRLSVTRRCVKSLPESKSNKPNKKGTELKRLTKIYRATEGISVKYKLQNLVI